MDAGDAFVLEGLAKHKISLKIHFTFHTIFAYYSPMGGERSSTARRRISGEICYECRNSLSYDPNSHGERLCLRCTQARRPKKRVYLSFMYRMGWHCQFLEADLKVTLPRHFNFATEEKVTELVKRCGGLGNLEAKHALEHGLATGRGGLYLMLTSEQYEKLRKVR